MKKMTAVIFVLLLMIIGLSLPAHAVGDQLATPRITACESLDQGVRIIWDPVEDASLYRVYYLGGRGWTKMGETSEASFVDTDVSSGSTYRYTVRCLNAEATAFTSDYDRVGFSYTYNMATPQITKFEDDENGVHIEWEAVPNASRYRIYYKNSRGGWTKMAETDKTAYLDDDVRCGSTYTYTVRCIDASGRRFTSSFNSSGWTHTYYLPSPQITGFRSIGRGVQISWDKVAGAEKYRVYYYGRNGWTRMGETTGTSFIDDDVSVGSTYRYTVRCINSALTKFTSDCNAAGWRYTYDPQLDTPEITGIEAVANGVEIHWDSVDGGDLYRVYYRGSKGWTRMADVRGTSYVDTDVSGGHTYTYTVRCLSQGAKGFASDYDHNGTRFTLLKNPVIYDTAVYMDRIEFNVFASHCRSVRVYRKSGGGWQRLGEIDSEDDGLFVDYDVEPGKTYTYTARCVGDDGSFVSYFNTSGWKQSYTLSECLPELELFMYADGNTVLVHPKNDNKFGIRHFDLHVVIDGDYYSTFSVADKPGYIQASYIEANQEYLLYIVGTDANGREITQMNRQWVLTLETPADLKAEKTGDRRYLISWGSGEGGQRRYEVNLYSEDKSVDVDLVVTEGRSFEINLSNYPDDIEWKIVVWAAEQNDAVSVSWPARLDFRESDYNGE